jgi:hypothetical protein
MLQKVARGHGVVGGMTVVDFNCSLWVLGVWMFDSEMDIC